MPSDPIKTLLDQALAALGENRPEEAIKKLDQIGPVGAEIPDQLAYRGLALIKLGKPGEATPLLRTAVKLAPSQARTNFTLAVHLLEMGDRDEARKYAEFTRNLDPKFPGIDELLASLGVKVVHDPRLRLRDRLANPIPRPPEGPLHAFPSMEEHDKLWTNLGWALVVANFVCILLFWLHSPVHAPVHGEPRGLPAFGGLVPNVDLLSIASIFLYIAILLLCSIWTVVDMLDRRARFVWIVPLFPFCLCGVPAIGQALYMSLGRK